MKFGEWLLNELREKEISQSELSRRTGISTGAISDVISGRRNVGPDIARRVAEALRVPVEESYRAAGLLPDVPMDTDQDKWIRRVSKLLEEVKDERDQKTILAMIDAMVPKKKSKYRHEDR